MKSRSGWHNGFGIYPTVPGGEYPLLARGHISQGGEAWTDRSFRGGEGAVPGRRWAWFRLILTILISAWLCAGARPALSGESRGLGKYQPEEIAVLPRYCAEAAQMAGKSTPEVIARWTATLGPMVGHIHHYCRGLLAINRAQRLYTVSPQHRRFNWTLAIDEISYVIGRASDDYVLLPEFLYRRGYAAVRAGEDQMAVDDFQRALRLHPGYFPAAVELAKLQARRGRSDLAEATVATGLQHSPNAVPLLDLRRELARTPAGVHESGTPADQSERAQDIGDKPAATDQTEKPGSQ